jgi:hypothetical protein
MLFGDYIHHNKSHASLNHQDAKIGLLKVGKKGGKPHRQTCSSSSNRHDLDRWIANKEWNDLSLQQQNKARELSAIRQGKPPPPKLTEKTYKKVKGQSGDGVGKRKNGKTDKPNVSIGSTTVGDPTNKRQKSKQSYTKQLPNKGSTDDEE